MNKKFNEDGYIVLKKFFNPDNELQNIYYEISKLGNFIEAGFNPFKHFEEKNLTEMQRSNFYKILRYLPSLNKLSSSLKALELCRKIGLKFPVIMNSCNIRMDFPHGDEYLFHWHQDLTYLLGSINALTFWIPLTPVNKINGTIELVPGSHKNGIYDIEYVSSKPLHANSVLSPKDVKLKENPIDGIIQIEANPGDLVVFSQLLLHRSTPNRSDKTRWAVQLRYADAMSKHFYENNYPFGDSTNIYQTEYI